ncbi:MAG TPA: (d)CMP kinase [Firmicutes bacterium]|nr:(d)CMP kinase [Candidatus Fermentithermobacillaceae bacterium]
MRERRLRVAIDGPAGAGKSSVARAVARKLGYTYLDTGAMYRAVALIAVQRGIPLDDPAALGEMARSLHITACEEDGVFRVWVDGVELTHRLRDPGTDKAVKFLAMHRPVREVLVEIQRSLAREGSVVMEGRDITSVVLPDAEVKVFLTADVRERARRRWQELQLKGVKISWEEVLEELIQRDRKDLERDWGKLVRVPDAVLVDTTGKTQDEAVAEILRLCEEKKIALRSH